MTTYVLGPDLEPVEATHCDLCSPPTYWPVTGVDSNIVRHVLDSHPDSLEAGAILAALKKAER